MKLNGPQGRCGRCGEQKNICSFLIKRDQLTNRQNFDKMKGESYRFGGSVDVGAPEVAVKDCVWNGGDNACSAMFFGTLWGLFSTARA
jgi:hypothetical protein